MKPMNILMSGGTGFIGSFLVPVLKSIANVTCISRTKVDCLNADLSLWNGGIDPQALRGKFDLFLHMAGLYNLRAGQVEAMRNNLAATHVALTLAEKAGIPRFVQISTVAVTVKSDQPTVDPDSLDTSRKFPDAYSLSKAYAEELVRLRARLFQSCLVLRLGIVVGDQHQGRIHRIDGPYHAAQSLSEILAKVQKIQKLRWIRPYSFPLLLPGKSNRRLPLVPVDVIAQAIQSLCEKSCKEGWKGLKSLHLAPKKGVSASELFRSTLKHLGLGHQRFHLLGGLPDSAMKAASEWVTRFPREELEYLLSMPKLDTSETERILGASWCPEFPAYEEAFWKGYEDYVSNC